MKKLLISLVTVGVVGVTAFAASQAFFSDTETSTGNIFAAGEIDLLVDNESYVTNNLGVLVASPATSWTLNDLTGQLFFNFTDLKPGDLGEDTISLHVNDNDSWLCAAAQVTDDSDQTCTEPELEDDPSCVAPDTDGELAENLEFVFWGDDGDNVLEADEVDNIFVNGTAADLDTVGKVALADSSENVWGPLGAVPGGSDRYIGKAWCFGDLSADPEDQDGSGKLPGSTNGPLARGTGVLCSGASDANNAAQTDQVMGDLQFYAVQSRNNATFTCAQNYTPEWPDAEPLAVGALLSAYDQPTDCDVNVPADFATIQGAINDAGTTTGETVCVDAGTYIEDVNVNKSITLSGDGASATSTVNGVGTGEAGALVISADDVVVEGFNVIGTGVSAIRISGARDNVVVRYNKAVAAAGKNAFLTDGGQSNHTISHNIFEGSASQLVYVNGNASVANPSTDVDFLNNTFGGTATGPLLGMEANSSLVSRNKFSGSTGFTSVEVWEGDLLVNENNFNVVGQIHVTNSNGGTVNAEDNWWGDGDPSNNIGGSVDFTPFEVAAFPEN